MDATKTLKVYQDFTGGLNDRVSPIMLEENQLSVASNVLVNQRGILEKSTGYLKDHSPFPNSSDSFIRMLLNLRRGTSVDILIMAAQDNGNTNTALKVDFKATIGDGTSSYIGYTVGTADFTNGSPTITGTGTSWLSHLKAGDKIKRTSDADSKYVEIQSVDSDTQVTLVSNYDGTTGNTKPYIARIIFDKSFIPRGIVFNNVAIITNGAQKPMYYDNTTLKLITDSDVPSARYIESHKNRVFMASTGSFPSRIFWSATNDHTSWDAASEEDVFPQDNGSIVAIKSFGDSLIVFKNSGSTNAIYQVVGSFDDTAVGTVAYIRRVDTSENIGIIAERSPVVHNGYLYFLAETGLYRMDQRLVVQKVTYNLENLLSNLNFTLGPSTNKTYAFNSQTTWNTGTHLGTISRSDGSLQTNFFDLLNINNATQSVGGACVYIDTSNNVHIFYIDSSNPKIIRYKKWLASSNQVSIDEIVVNDPMGGDVTGAYDSLSCDIRGDGIIGVVARKTLSNGSAFKLLYAFSQRDAVTVYNTGTINITSGSNSVVGIGTSFLANVVVGNKIKNSVDGVDSYTEIQSVVDDTHLLLVSPYSGTSGTSVSYTVIRPWSTLETFAQSTGYNFATKNNYGISIRYRAGDNEPRAVLAFSPGVSNGFSYWGRVSGTWTCHDGGSRTGDLIYSVSLYLASDTNAKISLLDGTTATIVLEDDGGTDGASFTPSDTVSVSVVDISDTPIALQKTSGGNYITAFVNVGSSNTLKKRNHTTATTATIDATTKLSLIGYIINSSNQDNVYYNVSSGGNLTEKFTFENSSTLLNSTQNNIARIPVGDRGLHSNGPVFAAISFGSSANSLIVRRLSYRGIWTSPENSDTTLTAWGNYVVNNQNNNGATITQEIALNTVHPATSFNSVVPGALISSDPTQIFIINKITSVLGSFSGPSIGSIIDNYVGSGVDARQILGTSFKNELYYAVTELGNSANNKILLMDKFGAFLNSTYTVSSFEKFKSKLYAGNSLNGDLLVLLQGYNFSGSSYSLDSQFKEDFLDSIELEKDVYKIYILYEVKPLGSFNFSYRLDSFKSSGGSSWKVQTIDQTQNGFAEILVGQKARSIQCRIENASLDNQLGLIAFVIVYGKLNIR